MKIIVDSTKDPSISIGKFIWELPPHIEAATAIEADNVFAAGLMNESEALKRSLDMLQEPLYQFLVTLSTIHKLEGGKKMMAVSLLQNHLRGLKTAVGQIVEWG